MSRQCCFLCASDEGVFLDVTTDNKQQYYDQFEICSFVKKNCVLEIINLLRYSNRVKFANACLSVRYICAHGIT
ncbi:hypothetical protein E2986_13985 [Frieseomelitta varia]|uniref:Uncharacterized protein n=1 Tax=Frieseomelitta varia TaxID=561572 RepID=A0A833W4Y1_9HYME|nr:hypothetical protein E2986_13985 [Frieseomelitta varia]